MPNNRTTIANAKALNAKAKRLVDVLDDMKDDSTILTKFMFNRWFHYHLL